MNFDVGYISRPQLDLTGSSVSDMMCHWHRIGRLLSPSSAANRSTSTKFDSAVSVKLLVRIKPTRIGRIALCIRSVSGACRVRTGTLYPTISRKRKLAGAFQTVAEPLPTATLLMSHLYMPQKCRGV